jgi:hypothetical protein
MLIVVQARGNTPAHQLAQQLLQAAATRKVQAAAAASHEQAVTTSCTELETVGAANRMPSVNGLAHEAATAT